MPLDEIPANLHRSHSLGQNVSKDNGDRSSSSRPPPLAIQDMLKSRAEIGDVGIFAQRPSRIPRSNTQSSLGIPSQAPGSHHASQRPRRHRIDRHDPQIAGSSTISPRSLRRSDTVRSSQTAYQYQPRSRRPRPRPGPYPYQHPVHPSSSRHGLHSHRSLISLRSNPASSNFPSPYSRPQYYAGGQPFRRAPSPAMSNMYEYRNPQRRSHRHGSVGTAASSPRSLMSCGRSFQDYRVEHSGSVGSMRPLPSPAFGPHRYQSPRQPPFGRTMTPTSSLHQNHRVGSMISIESGPASPADSIVPFYYDYSESFHGSEALLQPLNAHPSIPEDSTELELESERQGISGRSAARSPFGARTGSSFSPAELPTKHNRRNSEQSAVSRHSRKASGKSDLSFRMSSQAIPEDVGNEHTEKIEAELETRSEPDTSHAIDRVEPAVGRHSTNSPLNWPSPSTSTFFTNASRSPRNLTDLAARAHSPVDAQANNIVGSIDAITRGATPQNKDQSRPRPGRSPEDYRLPTFKFRPLSIGMAQELRPSTSPVSIVYAVPEIVSPRPERPTSSQSRKRFSKILDADQNAAIVDSYISGHACGHATFKRLDRVDEASSPAKTPASQSPSAASTDKSRKRGVPGSAGPASVRERWSGVTSHDVSTVESLLDRHIECLGLKPGQIAASNASSYRGEVGHDLEHIPELEVPELTQKTETYKIELRPRTADSNRPTSLSSSAQRRLMPRRLFASIADNKTPQFPLASSESDVRFSLSWTDERATPSYGWLRLPSETHVHIPEAEKSTHTLLSGDFADVESGNKLRKFKVRRHSSPSLTPVSKNADSVIVPAESSGDGERTPCRRSRSDTLPRKEPRKHRKLKIHLRSRSPPHQSSSGVSDEWMSTEECSGQSQVELHRLGLTQVPISAVDGFAELDGDSANASQQSLTSILNNPNQKSPGTWSATVAAMPLPPRKPTGMRRKDSANTIRSHNSKRSIVEPVNTSRAASRRPSCEIRAQSSVPRLSTPAFGPAMRVSQFDLSAGYQMKSPRHKQSSFSEPKELLHSSPTKYARHSMPSRRRFDSLRQIMPNSIRSFTFSPQRSTIQQHVTMSQACRPERPASYSDVPSFPETVAMSDFAYKRHKLLEKLKEWCKRRCHRRTADAKKRRTAVAEGLLV